MSILPHPSLVLSNHFTPSKIYFIASYSHPTPTSCDSRLGADTGMDSTIADILSVIATDESFFRMYNHLFPIHLYFDIDIECLLLK